MSKEPNIIMINISSLLLLFDASNCSQCKLPRCINQASSYMCKRKAIKIPYCWKVSPHFIWINSLVDWPTNHSCPHWNFPHSPYFTNEIQSSEREEIQWNVLYEIERENMQKRIQKYVFPLCVSLWRREAQNAYTRKEKIFPIRSLYFSFSFFHSLHFAMFHSTFTQNVYDLEVNWMSFKNIMET